ncbi:MAG: LysR family transcriptional regulator [Myxococcales bacterium]
MVWDDVRYFLAVAREGSIRRAAVALGVNHSTVSRRIRQLEDRYGARLFDPLPSGFSLTPIGEDVLELAREIELDMSTLAARMAGRDVEIGGSVRISIGDNFVPRLAPLLARMATTYPGMQIQVAVSNHVADLVNREADIALRVSNLDPEPMVGQRIATMAMAAYASRRYLARNRGLLELSAFDWIGWDESWTNEHTRWMQQAIPKQNISCRVNSPAAMYEMTRAGAGVAHLLCYIGDADADLVRVIPEVSEFGAGLWLLTHPELRNTARIRAAIEFIEQDLAKEIDRIEGRSPGPARSRQVPDPHMPIR